MLGVLLGDMEKLGISLGKASPLSPAVSSDVSLCEKLSYSHSVGGSQKALSLRSCPSY